MVRWITVVLAIMGFGLTMVALTPTFPTPPDIKPERMPSVNPFAKGVASLGVVECAERESAVASAVSGVVTDVKVKVGDKVAKGDVLYTVDDRLPRAELVRLRAAVPVKQAAIERWNALPRAEDLPPLEAAVESAAALESAARVDVASREDDLRRLEEAVKNGARAEREALTARFALADANARLLEASASLAKVKADLEKARAGGWKPDLAIAQAELREQQAKVEALELELERFTIRAPRDGTILRREVEPGEIVGPGASAGDIVLGDLSKLYVRAQVDEEDIAVVRESSKALGRTRGVRVEDIPLRIVRVEPFARPKSQLSGANIERVDTRVIEVVLVVEGRGDHPLYPGLAVDVYIEATK